MFLYPNLGTITKQLLETLGISDEKAAADIGISVDDLHDYFKSRKNDKADFAVNDQIFTQYGVSPAHIACAFQTGVKIPERIRKSVFGDIAMIRNACLDKEAGKRLRRIHRSSTSLK